MKWKRLAVSALFAACVTGLIVLLFPFLLIGPTPDKLPGVGALAEALVTHSPPAAANEIERRTVVAQEASVAFSYWMLWAVIVQAALAGGALIALLKELQQSRQSSEAQLRAYLSIRDLVLGLVVEDGGALDVRLDTKIYNGGQTPAYRCVHMGAILPLTEDGARTFARTFASRPRLGREVQYTVHNGQDTDAGFQPGRPLIPQEINDIVEGRSQLYVFGLVEYDDVFRKRHATRFCIRLASPLLPEQSASGAIFHPTKWATAPFFNDSD